MRTTYLQRFGMIAAWLAALAASVRADLPVSGRPVPALANLDNIMRDYMDDPNRTISAGVLGISRGGRVIFLHAYGYLSPGVPLPETTLMRLASVVKPVTAAAIHRFSDTNGLGPAQLQRRAFNLSGNGGVLAVSPPATPDAQCQNITIGHLLSHSGGWDRDMPPPGDIPINRVRDAGVAMNNPDALPTRRQLVDWALQFPLNFPPGGATPPPPGSPPGTPPTPIVRYSNFGYLVLGEVLETLAAGGYLGYLRSEVLSAAHWIPRSEWGPATTLREQNDPREPGYVSAEGPWSSVFDYTLPIDKLPAAYGGNYHLETMLAHGGLIASAQAMLRFGSLFSVQYRLRGAGATQSSDIGREIPASGLPDGSDAYHTGSLPGTSTVLRQLGFGAGAQDDVAIYIAFNERNESGGAGEWAAEASDQVLAYLNLTVVPANTWPAETSDGFWIAVGAENATAGFGGFDSNFQGFQSALDRVTDGSYLRLRPGSQNWKGTVTKRVRLDAPEGPVRLGF